MLDLGLKMKIGIFSDVHGHLKELHQTLTLFESLQVDTLICCGDLVDKGKDSDAVVAIMRDKSIPCIQGNHDFKAQFTWFTHHEILSSQTIDYLSNLPPILSYTWAGIDIFVCHANPWQDSSVYISPDRPEALFREVINAVDEEIIIMGHTHHPMCVEIEGKYLINAGSIYGNRNRPERTCAILTLPDCQFDLYDIDTGQVLTLEV